MWRMASLIVAAFLCTALGSPNEIATVRGLSELAISPAGTPLAVGGTGAVQLFALPRGEKQGTLDFAGRRVLSVAFSGDGALLAAGAWNEIRVWETSSNELQAVLSGDMGQVQALSFTSEGKLLAGTSRGEVLLWELAEEAPLWTEQRHGSPIYDIAVSEDRTTAASAGTDYVALWSLQDGEDIHRLRATGRAWTVTFTPDGFLLVVGEGKVLRAWDTAVGLEVYGVQRHTGCIWSVKVSPDGETIATGSLDETVRVWHAASGELLHTWEGHGASVQSVSFSPDGSYLASGAGDGRVFLWKVPTGEFP